MLNIVILFIIAFDPQVPFFPNGVGFTFVISCLLFVPFVLKLMRSQSLWVQHSAMPIIIIFLIIFVYMLFRILMNDGGNFEFSLSLFKAFFVFLAVTFYFFVFYSAADMSGFAGKFASIYTVNALINFLAGTYPEYFSFLDPFRSQSISDSLGSNPYRYSFISGSGYFSIGTAYGLAALFLTYHLVVSRSKGSLMTMALIATSVAGFIAARTSFFAIFAAIVYVITCRPVYGLYLLAMSVFFVFIILLLPTFTPYVAWMQSFFLDFESSSSASHLLNEMYFWPRELGIFWGHGVVNNGAYPYTDAGYMQDILFGGLPFLILKLSLLLVVFLAINKISLFFSFLFCISVLVFHFKGVFLYNNAQGMTVVYMVYFYFSALRAYNVEG